MKPRQIRFRQADVTRAMKGAQAAGVEARVEIDASGRIAIIPIQGIREPDTSGIDQAVKAFRW